MDYGLIINIAIGFSMLLILTRFFQSNNSYEKIISFYLLFTQFILVFLNISSPEFKEIFDIIIILFLLKLVAVLFLLFNKKKI
jgi:multisubunit Na+/H+ antiporter MnhF subunit